MRQLSSINSMYKNLHEACVSFQRTPSSSTKSKKKKKKGAEDDDDFGSEFLADIPDTNVLPEFAAAEAGEPPEAAGLADAGAADPTTDPAGVEGEEKQKEKKPKIKSSTPKKPKPNK